METPPHTDFTLSRRPMPWILAVSLLALEFGSQLSVMTIANAVEENRTFGSLEIISDPPGAEWFIDQHSQGTTPGKQDHILVGNHQIHIKKPGFAVWNLTIQIKPGETNRVVAHLKTTKQNTIQSLGNMAAAYIKERRFTSPKEGNALKKYQEILAIDPNSSLGLDGLRNIVQSFQRLSQKAEQTGHRALAVQRSQKAKRVQAILEQYTLASDKPDLTQPDPPSKVHNPPLTKKIPPPKPTLVKNSIELKQTELPTPKDLPQFPVNLAPLPTATPKEVEKNTTTPPHATTPGPSPKATPKSDNPSAQKITTEPVTGLEFIEIPAGCFKMGSENNDPDERPIHEVCVHGFWLGRTEVTNGQYRLFDAKHHSTAYDGHTLNGDLQPVVNITWEQANRFAQWLSGRGGVHFRLPTEAEWEYAASTGTTTTFPWGDDPAEGCRYANIGDETAKKTWPKWNVFPCTDGYAETAPVGMFMPNKFGLHDMIGNVWEWVQDWYSPSYYPDSPKDNPKGPNEGFFRSARGGSWAVWPDYARTANRTGIEADHPDLHVGFRLVMTPS